MCYLTFQNGRPIIEMTLFDQSQITNFLIWLIKHESWSTYMTHTYGDGVIYVHYIYIHIYKYIYIYNYPECLWWSNSGSPMPDTFGYSGCIPRWSGQYCTRSNLKAALETWEESNTKLQCQHTHKQGTSLMPSLPWGKLPAYQPLWISSPDQWSSDLDRRCCKDSLSNVINFNLASTQGTKNPQYL